MKKYKIGIWGQFGDGIHKIADGQAVRTTIITNEIKQRYGENKVLIINTNNWKRHPFRFFFDTIKLNIVCDKIVIFPADNGFKTVVPILNFTNLFLKKELYDVVIGGYLPALLKIHKKYIRWLCKFKALFVQTDNLKKDIESFGLNNVQILSNLKKLTKATIEEAYSRDFHKIKVCTLSRINYEKGIEYAIQGVNLANEMSGNHVSIQLTVFGTIADNYKKRFNQLLEENSNVEYGGIIDYNKTSILLKDFFCLLFPTFYYGEGFPGNVVDAYFSGLPIIATDWLYNHDVIRDETNGYLIPIKDSQAICDALLKLVANRDSYFKIVENNLQEAEKYKPENVLRTFFAYMD